MTKSPSKISTREARGVLAGNDDNRKAAVLGELDALAGAEITDVLWWNSDGDVTVRSSEDLPDRMRKAIKKMKVRPTPDGNEIEVEMHDKLSALRLLAKHEGLLDAGSDSNKPTLIGINVKHAEVEYEVRDGAEEGSDGAEAEKGEG